VIRRKAQQKMVNLGGKVDAITGRSDHTALAIDTDGKGNTTARLDATVDVENDPLA
jgi:hypothetical protein